MGSLTLFLVCNFMSQVTEVSNIVYRSGINVYNMYGDCATSARGLQSTTPAQANMKNLFRQSHVRRLVKPFSFTGTWG